MTTQTSTHDNTQGKEEYERATLFLFSSCIRMYTYVSFVFLVCTVLVLSIVTFNLIVSQGLPAINYATLLDWYVWYCFVYVVGALGEVTIT